MGSRPIQATKLKIMERGTDLLGQLVYPGDTIALSGTWGMDLRVVKVVGFTPVGFVRYQEPWRTKPTLHKSTYVKLTKEQLQNYKPEE